MTKAMKAMKVMKATMNKAHFGNKVSHKEWLYTKEYRDKYPFFFMWMTSLSSMTTWNFPDSTGLCLGLISVGMGQIVTLGYLYLWNRWKNRKILYSFRQMAWNHLTQIEGLCILGAYLCISWYGRWLPVSYYTLNGSIQWSQVGMQLVVQDIGQYVMHRLEHTIKPLYRIGHQYHHKHIHPRWYHAFEGSIVDTGCMILIPLMVTSQMVRNCNTWTYMVFGTIYSMSLVCIHSEYDHPWEYIFQLCLIGTSKDHQLHHRYFTCNYGHVFMWWDVVCGTYRRVD